MNELTSRLLKKLKRKVIKYSTIGITIFLLFAGMLSALYETPLAIFLPKLEEGADIDTNMADIDTNGYENISDKLEPMYVSFNSEIYSYKTGTADFEVQYDSTETNFYDVIQVYACVAASSGTNNPCKMNNSNTSILQDVFDKMNTYDVSEEVVVDIADGDKIGKYYIGTNYEHAKYGSDPIYKECIVSNNLKEIIPLNSVIKIGNKKFRVVAHESLPTGVSISVCLKNSNSTYSYENTSKNIYFVSTAEVPQISHIKTVVTVHTLSGDGYIASYGMDDAEIAFYNEIGEIQPELFSSSLQQSIDVIYTPLGLNQQEFIDTIGSAAVAYYDTYRILPSLTIAQAILESNWGNSRLASECFNFFGMKWKEGCGCAYKEYSTKEQGSNGLYTTTAKFRKYDSIEKGIEGYYQFISYKRYSNLVGVTDYQTACRLIKEDGWATDDAYRQKLVGLIQSYNLTIYDDVAMGK